jgi:hypothetical protein
MTTRNTLAAGPRDRRTMPLGADIMVQNEEEWRRLAAEEDKEPYLPGYTYGEFKALSERQKSREYQKLTQHVTSFLGFWKTCNLSACRRARACRGFLTEAQYNSDPRYHSSYPPCVGPRGARQQEVLASFNAAFGYPPDEDEEPKYAGRGPDGGPEFG